MKHEELVHPQDVISELQLYRERLERVRDQQRGQKRKEIDQRIAQIDEKLNEYFLEVMND